MGLCFSHIGRRQAVGSDQMFAGVDTSSEAIYAFRGTRGLSSVIELSVSASNLQNRDELSKSHPLLVLHIKGKDGALEELGRSEVCLNSLSPEWSTKLLVSYSFEEVQVLLFRVYDIDTTFKDVPVKRLELQEQQFLGEIECALPQIITAPGQTVTRVLQLSKEKAKDVSGMLDLGLDLGSLTVMAKETGNSKYVVEIRVHGSDLDNKDVFSKSDPFLTISKRNESGSYTEVYKTEVKKNILNPTWKTIQTSLQQLCNGDMDCPLKFECWNFNVSGRHDLIGSLHTSLHGIKKCTSESLVLDLEQGKSSNKAGGKLHFEHCAISTHATFLDYIMSGFELSFSVAIDFTASNGNPCQKDSLHYIDPSGRLNAYQAAICAVGEVLEYYNSNKRFSVWGFGGRFNPDEPVSHCFNLSRYSEEVNGLAGILEVYSEGIHTIRFAGPTVFGHVIEKAATVATASANIGQRKYFVLLIITDGVSTDLQESINALVKASGLPLSVCIVGVGGTDADFTQMEYLEAGRGRLQASDKNRVASRDMVQFVRLQDTTGAASLAHTLLAELPTQFLEYMREMEIAPTATAQASQ